MALELLMEVTLIGELFAFKYLIREVSFIWNDVMGVGIFIAQGRNFVIYSASCL